MKSYRENKPEKFNYKFNGKYISNWFSNMVKVDLEIDGKIWPSVENYFQAMKTFNEDEQEKIRLAEPHKSKQLGKKVKLRPDWEKVKVQIMKEGLIAKFRLDNEWGKRLLETGEDPIIEWNNWNDKYWGVSIYDCLGENVLGELLMEIRDTLRSILSFQKGMKDLENAKNKDS